MEDKYSPPTSPDLIMSSQASPQDIITTPQDINTTCSQDLFGDVDPIQSSKVCSSTPINSSPVVRIECKHDQLVDDGSTSCLLNDATEKSCHSSTQEQVSIIPNCNSNSINSAAVVNDAPCCHDHSSSTDQISSSPNCNPSSVHSVNTANNVENHVVHSNSEDEISVTPICNPDPIRTASNQFHDNSDLMDELFANHLTQITSATTSHDTSHKDIVFQPTSAPCASDSGRGSTGNNVINDDSGCGLTESDVVTDDTPSHTISDKLHITPMRTNLYPGVHRNIRSSNMAKKSTKQFRAPRLAKEVSKDEEKKSLERLAKQFPSLAPSSTPVSVPSETISCPSSERVSCGFVAASGKKLTISTSALDHAAKLVEECSNDADNAVVNLGVIPGEVPVVVPDLDAVHSKEKKETELTDSYCAENMDSIDMDQFSAFTQMPGYVTKRAVEEVSSVKGDTPSGRSTLFTPGGSPPLLHPRGTSPSRPAHEHDEDSIHKMFNTQVVKQFLDFHSSDEDDDKTSEAATVPEAAATDELASYTYKDSKNYYLKSQDAHSSIYEDAAIKSHDPHNPTHKTTSHTNGHNQMMLSGFTTAGGKSVMVSVEAVASVKKLLEDEEAGITGKDDAIDIKDDAPPVGGYPGLSTASGKKVDISSQSLRVAQQFLREGEDNPVGYQTPVVKFNGFCTAAGSVVKVSEESMKKAKKLLDEDLTHDSPVPSISLCDDKQSDDAITPAGVFPGLSTASGKKVEISAQSLHAAQQLLREGDDLLGIANGYQTPVVKFNGFCTAAGSVVKVSEESIKKAKKLLDEDSAHHNDPVPSISLCDGKQSDPASDAMDTTPANTDKVGRLINL